MSGYIMYLRKSRTDRGYAEESVELTLSRHRERLEELCRTMSIHCDTVLQEVSSADSITGRPEMIRLLQMVETGAYDGVVCIDMDRLSRGSGADQALVINTFKYSDIVSGDIVLTADSKTTLTYFEKRSYTGPDMTSKVHEEVISNLNLNYSYSKIRSMLSVTNSSGTRMLDISFTSPSPAEAAAVANEYAKVASKYIQDTMATDKPNIMSVALEPTNPVSPSRVRNIALGFILGALLAAGIVVFRFLMDDKIKTTEDIRQYAGLVTLAVVPIDENSEAEIVGKTKKKKNQRRKA